MSSGAETLEFIPSLEREAPKRERRWRKWLDLRLGIAAFSLAAMLINTFLVLRASRNELRAAIDAAVERNARSAEAFEDFTARTLQHADDVARLLASEYARGGAEIASPSPFATKEIANPAFFASASIVDEHGRLVSSSAAAAEMASLEIIAREAVAALAAGDSVTLMIGKPSPSAVDGKPLVPLTRRINRPDGSFGGVALLQIAAARFTDFAAIEPGSDDVLAVVGRDGIARARRSGSVTTAGEDLQASSMFAELATRNSGDLLSESPVDGVRRFFSYRVMPDYPLIVGVAASEAATLAAVAQRTRWYYVRAGVLSVILALLSILVIRALTRQKRAADQLAASEASLRTREAELRALTESMPQIVWMADASGHHYFYNGRCADHTGLSVEETLGDGWKIAIHPDDRAQVVSRWEDAASRGERFEMQYRLRRVDGTFGWVLGRALPMRDNSGKIVKWFGTATDIDMQIAVQNQNQEQAELLNLTRDAVVVRGVDDTIRFWNRGAEHLYGWSAAEVMGKKVSDLAYNGRPGVSDAAEFAAAKACLAKHGQWSGEMRHARSDGTIVTVSSRWTAVPNRDATASSVLVVDTDISEHKKVEAQLLRTQRLESIGTLASGVAHDLNNVLSPVLLSAQLLRREMTAEKRNSLVSIIEQSAERGAGIVRQVLTFARGADGERVLIQPAELLGEMVKLAGETFPRSISIRTRFPDDLRLVEGDSTQLHQVLLNLCLNARDAMPEGGSLTLAASNFDVDDSYAATTADTKPGPYVLIEVSDTGTGVPQHVIDKIFDPFFTTKGVGKGTGLGLSTVLGIVRAHGGVINASSSSAGTTFRVLLPAARDTPMPSNGSNGAAEAPAGQGETILIVDDELAVRVVAETVLQKNGYNVLLAEDGPGAVALFAQQAAEIDLVLTDLSMPIMDGFALARTLRKIDPHALIVISTGRENEFTPADLAESGIRSQLAKPYSQTALLRLLHQVLHAPTSTAT